MLHSNFRKLLTFYMGHKRETARFFILTTVHSISFLYVPYLFREATNIGKPVEEGGSRYSLPRWAIRLFGGEKPSLERQHAIVFGSCVGYLVGLGALSRWRIINNRVLEDLITQDIRRRIVSAIYRQPSRRLATAQLTQKAISDVNFISASSTGALFSMLRGGVFFVGGLGALIAGFPKLAVLSLPFVSLLAFNSYYNNDLLRHAIKEQLKGQSRIGAEIAGINDNLRTARTQQCMELLMPLFERRLDENHRLARCTAAMRGRTFMLTEVFGVGYLLSIVAYSSYLIAVGQLETENVLMSLYAIYATLGVRGFSSGYSDSKEKIGAFNSLEEFLGEELAQPTPASAPAAVFDSFERLGRFFEAQVAADAEAAFEDPETRAATLAIAAFLRSQRQLTGVEVRGVWLRHGLEQEEKRQKAAGQQIAFIDRLRAEAGEHLGVQGRSGLGKSTLFDVLCSFSHVIAGGSVRFDAPAPRIFYFTQQPEVFNHDFLLNVVLANMPLLEFVNSSPDDALPRMRAVFLLVREVLQAVNLWQLAKGGQRKGQLHSLSPGEKQRLVFARLFFSNCDLALLDESVSNIDGGHYQRLLPRLQAFLAGRTCLVISHNEQFLADLCRDNIYHLKRETFPL